MRFFTQSAFTLIELMITLVISAVLLSMAIPSYENYIAHAQRNRAEAALLQLSGKLENFFTKNGTYIGATIKNLQANKLTRGLQYTLNISKSNDASFEIQAIPKNAQISRDVHCGTLTVNQKNERTVSGKSGVKRCWK
ncbi:MAG: pilus assembly protein PilE [Gammaproteobacteria bacterium CG_4_10_14_0_8_um_filter_38_16]|nr:MAG: pilus assembly protein PilE [Gammaproteobacteria bacterium CG_4_10_14_0_8_um_filter_38_16]PJA02741.1 MAG: pilus assembly protein PilE [Gammaproteobacteria bacterium CG_4_10_14_0_2_um_filter_38_22]PJB09816.1 MAG: pilus assembly protein PilE [Gammaproteobacteria bacterium CG_4_9_14_3_um_filter_38_9]